MLFPMNWFERCHMNRGHIRLMTPKIGTFPCYSSDETFPQAQPCVTASSVFYPAGKERHLPLESTGHAVQYSNTDYHYQPIA